MATSWTAAVLAVGATALAALELFVVPQTSPILFGFTDTHGLHASDLVVVSLWLVVMAFCWRLVRRGRMRPPADPAD